MDVIVFPSRFESLKRQTSWSTRCDTCRPDVRLVLVGRGPDEDALRRQIEEHELGERVSIEVGVTDERLRELYPRARSASTTGRSTRTTGT